jgi:hypothetical protein
MRHWTRAEVDAAVARWNSDLHLATKNILELMDDFYYKWLAGDGGHAPATLKGLTEREVTPAIKALDELWQVLPALTKVLDEVNERHQNLPRFMAADELFEIQQLIAGASVKITTKTTYAQRGLLTPDEVTRAATPERILHAMVAAYGQAKAVVVKVSDALSRLNDQLDQSAREVKELRALADALGEPVPELRPVEAKLADLQTEIMSDPLSVADGFDTEILPAIAPVRQRLADVQAEHARLDTDLASADALIVALEEALAQAKTAYDERVLKVTVDNADSLPGPFADSVIDALKSWLGRLKKTLQQGKWRAAQLGFGNWKAQLDARLAECQTVASENARLVNRRRELRGLLDSLKAKAVDTGLAEDQALAELYRRAYALLYSRPTPLATAEKLVSDYLAAVR